jgi:hypothetical protein
MLVVCFGLRLEQTTSMHNNSVNKNRFMARVQHGYAKPLAQWVCKAPSAMGAATPSTMGTKNPL